MRYTITKSVIDVIGRTWIGYVGATTYELTDHDLQNVGDDDLGKVTRDSVDNWLGAHAGDFQEIMDFRASLEFDETYEIDWLDEESEITFNDRMYPIDDAE